MALLAPSLKALSTRSGKFLSMIDALLVRYYRIIIRFILIYLYGLMELFGGVVEVFSVLVAEGLLGLVFDCVYGGDFGGF